MDAGLLPALSLGFLFGLQHATDSDHVVAVATIVSRTRRFDAGALIGAFWGIGHTATIAAVGMAITVLNVTVTPSIGLTMELAVALMLMGLGIFRVVRAVRERGEAPHPAPRATHGLRGVLETVGRAQAARSVGIGLVHGLAGSAAVALLVLSTVRSPYAARAYLALFGLGTIVGVTAITSLLSPTLTEPVPPLNRVLALGTGVLSFGFGLYLTVQIGFVDGLLVNHFPWGHPVWTPR